MSDFEIENATITITDNYGDSFMCSMDKIVTVSYTSVGIKLFLADNSLVLISAHGLSISDAEEKGNFLIDVRLDSKMDEFVEAFLEAFKNRENRLWYNNGK